MPPREKMPAVTPAEPDETVTPDADVRVAELEAENAELRHQLDAARRSDGRFTTDAEPRPYFNEAMRHELATQGWTVDPTTGKKITEDPRGQQ